MRHATLLVAATLSATLVAPLSAQDPAPAGPPQTPPAGGAAQGGGAGPQAAANRSPRPYDQVISAAAKSERGVLAVHKVGDRYFFEIDDAMLGRDFLLVSRISGVPAGSNSTSTAASSRAERMVRWEKRDNNILVKGLSVDSYTDEETPIAKSVAQNHFAPILASFPIAAFGKDNASSVVDVTDFFANDTPALWACPRRNAARMACSASTPRGAWSATSGRSRPTSKCVMCRHSP